MTNKDIALSYLNKGLSVIPIWSFTQIKRKPPSYFVDELNKRDDENKANEKPKSDDQVYQDVVTDVCKRPMINWKEFQDRLPTEQEVTEWFRKWPDANLAIVTGRISNLVVFDLDSDGAVEYAENEGGFPDTVKVKTRKGYHVYMQYPGLEVRGSVNKGLDIDIRADGGYVVAPPSIHGSGNVYEWEPGYSIHEIDLAPCEQWHIDYLKSVAEGNKKEAQEKLTENRVDNRNMGSTKASQSEYTDIFRNGAVEGMRNHTTTKLAGHLFAKGLAEFVVWEILKTWNMSKNTPPLDESELRKTFESVRKLEGKNKKKKIEISQFLDTAERVVTEYDQQYIRIPFAGKLLPIMESKMNGGLIGGRVYFLGGIPSSGKTEVANNIADNICLNGHPILFFSYDDGRTELRYRTYCRFSGFDIEEFNNCRLSKSDMETIFKNSPISLISKNKYVVQEIFKIEDWGRLIDKIKKRHGKVPVIIVDYLRKLKTENTCMDERLRVDDIVSGLTGLSKTHNLPILVISELARDSYKSGQRLGMASFKETGTIEYEASWLGILAAVEEDDEGYSLKRDWERIIEHDGNIDLIVFKAKRGTGATGRIPLKLNKSKMTVRDRIESVKNDSVTPLKRVSKFD